MTVSPSETTSGTAQSTETAQSRAFPVRHGLRRVLASVTRRLPAVRGLGRCILAADRWLTDSAEPASYETVARVNGNSRLILDLRTWEQKFAFYYGTYEPELIAATERLFADGVFYDIGASIGLYTVPMGHHCQKHGGYVRAFEPVPQNQRRLEAQLAENALSSEVVQIEKIALSDKPGTAMMDLCDDGKPGNAKITGSGQVTVQVTTLDMLWAKRNHEAVSFIKIDTEGWDANIVAGGQACIRRCQPNMLIEFNRERMHNHGIALEPAWSFLVNEMQYQVFRIDEREHVAEVQEPADLENLFFVREADVHRIRAEPAESSGQATEPLRILVGADVSPDPNAGASGTVWQMNAALRRRGHLVDEIWAEDLGRRIRHGNLHYLLELPRTYCREVNKASAKQTYDVIELNQPHAFRAARDHCTQQRGGVFVNRSHGHETRSEENLEPWRRQLGISSNRGLRRVVSGIIRRLLDRQWQSISRSADGFVVSCTEDAEFLKSRYAVADRRIGRITQGVPQVFLNQPIVPMSAARLQRVLYIGQLAFFKAPHVLAESVNLILQQNASATMTWVCGESHHQEAMRMLSADVRARVTLVNWMDQTGLQQQLDTHGTFLFPSYFEGFGKAPLEAMSRGLCVTATAVGGMRDYIEDGVSGRLVTPGRPDLVAEAALDVINNPSRGTEISAAARAAAEQHTWDRCAADVEAFYRQLLRMKAETSS